MKSDGLSVLSTLDNIMAVCASLSVPVEKVVVVASEGASAIGSEDCSFLFVLVSM